MTRVVSVGRSKGLFLASSLGIALLASLTGCPGTLDNPGAFPPPMTGMAGTNGGAGTGAAGTGAAGTGVMGTCDAPTMVFAKYSCSLDGACHGAMPAAGFDMKTAGWETMLVGVNSKGGGMAPTMSKCGGNTTPYIVKGSNPAQGLLIDKLTKAVPPCGAQMPNLNCCITAAEQTCVIQWATTLANK